MKAENFFRLLGCLALATLISYAVINGESESDLNTNQPSALEANLETGKV